MANYHKPSRSITVNAREDKLHFDCHKVEIDAAGDTVMHCTYRLKYENTPRVWLDSDPIPVVYLMFLSSGSIYKVADIAVQGKGEV